MISTRANNSGLRDEPDRNGHVLIVVLNIQILFWSGEDVTLRVKRGRSGRASEGGGGSSGRALLQGSGVIERGLVCAAIHRLCLTQRAKICQTVEVAASQNKNNVV